MWDDLDLCLLVSVERPSSFVYLLEDLGLLERLDIELILLLDPETRPSVDGVLTCSDGGCCWGCLNEY